VDDTARALIGRTLGGRFKLTSFIGEGAMATVFRGEQSAEPRHVAVKVMHRGLSSDRAFVKRFEREARAAACIDHPNTVRILEHGFDKDVVYIAMELLTGHDLFEVLSRERRLSEARAVRILLQICAALEAAHRHGVVHRDLKPENVMLVSAPGAARAEVVKVLDFGIAKLLERDPSEAPGSRGSDSIITLVGTVIGTPEYMSPEQARGIPPVDARTDVYACGVLLYQLVTGRLPFTGESPIDVILQHVERAPAPPSSFVPRLHVGLERVILRALAKWPAQRQQSARALADELGAILPELDGRGPQAPSRDVLELADVDELSATLQFLPNDLPRAPLPAPLAVAPFAHRSAPPPSTEPEPPSPWATASQTMARVPTPPASFPELVAPARHDEGWTAPWWVLSVAIAILVTAMWLARYGP
jgi:eukaryotic-like serine/threonine-protein kinase